MVRVRGIGRPDLRHAVEQFLFLVVQGIPGTHVIQRVGHILRKWIDSGVDGIFGNNAPLFHAFGCPFAIGLVTVIEFALVFRYPFLGSLVGRMVGAGVEPHEEGFGRVGGVLVTEHLDGLVGEVLGQVVAILGQVRLLDEIVVLDQERIPLVGLAAEEAVEAVPPLLQRPFAAISARRHVNFRHIVVLAEPQGRVAIGL